MLESRLPRVEPFCFVYGAPSSQASTTFLTSRYVRHGLHRPCSGTTLFCAICQMIQAQATAVSQVPSAKAVLLVSSRLHPRAEICPSTCPSLHLRHTCAVHLHTYGGSDPTEALRLRSGSSRRFVFPPVPSVRHADFKDCAALPKGRISGKRLTVLTMS